MKSFLLFGICYSSMLFANSIETIGVYGTYGFSKLQLGITDFDNDLNYPPNLIKGKVGLGLKYGFYDFSLAFNLPQSQAASGIKGESKHFESLIDYWGDKYAFEGYLQYYEGFYLESDSSQTFPDLKAKKIGINVIRPFLNDKVTPKLINGKMNLNTSEVSEASLLIILSSYYTELESSESLVTNTAIT